MNQENLVESMTSIRLDGKFYDLYNEAFMRKEKLQQIAQKYEPQYSYKPVLVS